MFLEKLQIQGFKSFAGKNTLVFPEKGEQNRKGITAVVGPNGSGKSNIADAVRWALGEQSMKTLRAKANEDVIFSGSSQKGRLGMSEVSLYLNNEDKQAPIDYSELVITRRLYRNGENEYLINNTKTKLTDIQMLLAKANFGQKTYSVIGQGMVDEFLKTSPAERKNFFDEATGIKQYQLKRERSLNKLITSQENLKQAEMLLQEIEPRLKSLTKQVNKLRQKNELQEQLNDLRDKYYRNKWHLLHDKFNQYNEQLLELENIKNRYSERLQHYNQELSNIEQEEKEEGEIRETEQELNKSQQQRENIVKQIATLNAQIEVDLDSQGKFDVSWLHNREEELKEQIKKTEQEWKEVRSQIKSAEEELQTLRSEKTKLEKEASKFNKELFNLVSPENKQRNIKDQDIQENLRDVASKINKLKEIEDIKTIKEFVSHIEKILEETIKMTSKETEEGAKNTLRKKEDLQKKLNQWEDSRRQKEEEINNALVRLNSLKQQKNLLKTNQENLTKELDQIQEKLARQQQGKEQEEILNKKRGLEKELEKIDSRIADLKDSKKKMDEAKQEQNKRIFSLQKEVQKLQEEINQYNNQINEIRTTSTRYETKLEELEEEIREEIGDVKDIKDKRAEKEVDLENTKQKMDKIKNQLSQIGGIDPEVESEYEQTREKYDFLMEQTKDLTESISNLKNIIKDLDQTIKKRFDKEFKIISQKFEEYFKTLFQGGSAKIIKVPQRTFEEEEEEEQNKEQIKNLTQHNATGLAGIDIQATPPGKRINSLSVLSGGEKALTSIALICAIISANPSPFVVLDEVDAALDESNSQKFARILEELSHKTQFILITHNRASMHKADILYGTTMDEQGVTKLLSLKLEEAKKKVK